MTCSSSAFATRLRNEGKINPDDNDAVAFLGPHADVEGAYNVVLGHISASWGEDKLISTWYGVHDITISRSSLSEGLNRSRHRKETRSAGLLIIDGRTHEVANNVIYDRDVLPAEIMDTASNSFLNFIGNSFIPGPSTQTELYEIISLPRMERRAFTLRATYRRTVQTQGWTSVRW